MRRYKDDFVRCRHVLVLCVHEGNVAPTIHQAKTMAAAPGHMLSHAGLVLCEHPTATKSFMVY